MTTQHSEGDKDLPIHSQIAGNHRIYTGETEPSEGQYSMLRSAILDREIQNGD